MVVSMATRRLTLARAALAALAPALSFSCIKAGTDVGPKLPQVEDESSSGIVIDPKGNPVSNAIVTVDGDSTFTDQRGRFRFHHKSNLKKVVNVDARWTTSTAAVPGIFDRLAVSGHFDPLLGIFEQPVVMPDFAGGASATISINAGQTLSGTLVDPATGAELVLDGAIATLAGTSQTTATIRFASVPADAVTKALVIGGTPRAGVVYFAISPSNVNFTVSPVVRVTDATFHVADAVVAGKVLNPELDRLGIADGEWDVAGAAQIGGGFLSSGAVAGGGMFCLSVASASANRTVVTARLIDQELEPLRGAQSLARDGRAAMADESGLLAIPNVVAADANDQILDVHLMSVPPVFRAQAAVRDDVLPGKPGVGMTTDFQERPLPTIPAGRARILAIFEGEKRFGARVGIATATGAIFEDTQFATVLGTEFWDVPVGVFNAVAVDDFNNINSLRTASRSRIEVPGSTVDLTVFMQKSRVRPASHRGAIRELAVREMSLTPVFNSYHQAGLNGAANQAGFTFIGLSLFGNVLPGLAYSTVAQQNEAPGFGIGGIDKYRKTAYHTHLSQSAYRRNPVDVDIRRLPNGLDRAGASFGSILQLTNPLATPPAKGAYAVELRAQRTQTFDEALAIALTAQTEIAARLDRRGRRPSFDDPEYEIQVPVGVASLAVVERDAATAESDTGAIVRFGGVSGLQTFFGRRDERDIAVDIPVNQLFQTTVLGPSTPAAVALVYETAEGTGLSLGDQSAFTFAAGTLNVTVPSSAQNRVGVVGFEQGTTANGSTYENFAAAVSNEPGGMAFLTIPVLTNPAPPPGQNILISPQTTGISWAADPDATETRIEVRRSSLAPDTTGKNIQSDSVWSARVPGSPGQFIFPTTPATAKNVAVPAFFESGATYTLTIESLRYLQYDERASAASPDSARPSFFAVRAVARTKVNIQVP
jgi:hypothetical protein